MDMTETYATVAYADDLLLQMIDTSDWMSATDQQKEQALRAATRNIDMLSAVGLKGVRASADQLREFPRLPDADVPQSVKSACCYEALELINQHNSADFQRVSSAVKNGLKSVSIGDVSESYANRQEMSKLGVRGILHSELACLLMEPYTTTKGVYPIR